MFAFDGTRIASSCQLVWTENHKRQRAPDLLVNKVNNQSRKAANKLTNKDNGESNKWKQKRTNSEKKTYKKTTTIKQAANKPKKNKVNKQREQ